MSDTDWSNWMDSQKVEDSVEEVIADTSSTHINDLGEYELIQIFGYFTIKVRISLSRLCHKWRNCIEKTFKSESVLDTTKVGSNTGISEKAVCLLIRKCCNVRHISLRGMNSFVSSLTDSQTKETTDNIVDNIVSNCSRLESIDFGSLGDFDQYFDQNIDYFKHLKKIISQKLSENSLNLLLDSQVLESIDICRNDNISRPQFQRLGPKITELKLIDSEVYEEMAIKDLCIGNGKRLQSLSIDIKDKCVMSLICRHLEQLKTFKVNLYSNECDFKLFSNLKHLKTLELEVMDDMTLKPQEFSDLIRSLNGIHLIELKVILSPMNNIAVKDNSFLEIRQNCKSIEKLVIRRANSITGTGMYDIAQLKRLRHLDLMDCLNITDNIDVVITSCPLLRELILHNCSHISNTIVEMFTERAKSLPKEKFFLDVIDSNVSPESLPLESDRPNNLKLLYEFQDCVHEDCNHGWDPNGYNSGPEDDDMDHLMNDLDFYDEADDYDDFDDYDDNYGDIDFS